MNTVSGTNLLHQVISAILIDEISHNTFLTVHMQSQKKNLDKNLSELIHESFLFNICIRIIQVYKC